MNREKKTGDQMCRRSHRATINAGVIYELRAHSRKKLKSIHQFFCPLLFIASIIFFISMPNRLSASQYGGMFFSGETYAEIAAWLEDSPVHEDAPQGFTAKGAVSLLDHLHYTPSLRDQAPTGTCWIWSHTAAMSIDFDIQFEGNPVIQEGFSVPFLASNAWMVGSDLNKGGHSGIFKEFYDMIGYAVPSRNTYAMWNAVWNVKDSKWEVDQSFGIRPAMWINSGSPSDATEANYPIEKMDMSIINTFGTDAEPVSKEQAIANIKSILDSGHSVPLMYTLATGADWDVFDKFWAEQNESVITSFDYTKGHTWDDGGCGHWVLCVGYDDSGAQPYWIILNSHYPGNIRPNNLFRLSQDIDYRATYVNSPYPTNRVYVWVSLQTTFAPKGTVKPNEKGVKTFNVNTSRSSKVPSDSIHVVSASFETVPSSIVSANLKVNYHTFTCDSTTGTWKKSGDLWKFKSKTKENPSVTVTIDTKGKTWSAKVLKADLSRTVNPGDGAMYKLEYKASDEDDVFTILSGGAAVCDKMNLKSTGLIKGP